ncbi:rhodanese-like domain-containing protein [Novipirellula artificiosorum]|uniref:Inner membrane protein YgaP n=1 Tax=Novipirellula artificiosorum TaxID=2528016 RepID=A0A5C6D4V6_9BACT|nr:rhodanese-like domain-containing protein [Novipirellula artificiosorum]TWU30974.1 Inner membrane protein YgaP [Novipirellula artificiosorum]
MSEVQTISVRDLAALEAKESIELIDVRTPAEFRGIHAESARNLPLDALDPDAIMKNRSGQADAPLYVICRSGGRATKACQQFIQAGYNNVVNVEGGTSAWDSAGLPVVRGKQTMSLERQTRIAVGVIVLISGVLAVAVNPYFAVIAAMMGAGLAFAGITDSCMLGMMLAKMPWNQAGTEVQACAVK